MRKTKIVCTLGPATDDVGVLKRMIQLGMNVARLNFSHGTHADHKVRIDAFKAVRKELDQFVALLLDTKGPEIRTGILDDAGIDLVEGDGFTLTTREVEGTNKIAHVNYANLPKEIHPGNFILIDDGLIELEVLNATKTDINCRIKNGGHLGSRKGVNIPNVTINMPYISEQDRADIIFGIEQGVDFIAASFVRTAYDVLEVRSILENNGGGHIDIIAKIENNDGVKNIDEILKVCDGIMVARGDMGVEIPLEDLPYIQKMLIQKCYQAGKKAITATQMLESMIRNPRPTRAEVTDIANAIYDGTSAIMLSGETAVGKYPMESVATMAQIAKRTEDAIDYDVEFNSIANMSPNVTNAISHATCTTAIDLGAAAIISITKSGHTARMVSKFRPSCPIIAASMSASVCRQLAMSWGVIPVLTDEKSNLDELFEHAVECAMTTGLIGNGDIVIITGSANVGFSGATNILKVHLVGDVLVKGVGINAMAVSGSVCVAQSESEALSEFEDDNILVISKTSNSIMQILKQAKGIITEEEGLSSHAAVVGMTLDIPVITGAANCTRLLTSGTTVTMDCSRGFVYNGIAKIL